MFTLPALLRPSVFDNGQMPPPMAVCLHPWPHILRSGPCPTATAPRLCAFAPRGVNGFLLLAVLGTLPSILCWLAVLTQVLHETPTGCLDLHTNTYE